jgi:hypothetical protein
MDWTQLSLAEKLGNIGSELHRAKVWQDKGDVATSKKSLERAIELIDLSLNEKTARQSARKELARLREIIADLFVGANYYSSSIDDAADFCLDFAFLVRK